MVNGIIFYGRLAVGDMEGNLKIFDINLYKNIYTISAHD